MFESFESWTQQIQGHEFYPEEHPPMTAIGSCWCLTKPKHVKAWQVCGHLCMHHPLRSFLFKMGREVFICFIYNLYTMCVVLRYHPWRHTSLPTASGRSCRLARGTWLTFRDFCNKGGYFGAYLGILTPFKGLVFLDKSCLKLFKSFCCSWIGCCPHRADASFAMRRLPWSALVLGRARARRAATAGLTSWWSDTRVMLSMSSYVHVIPDVRTSTYIVIVI